ncbi:TetR family transcriptional regulator [Streptomyces sp. SP18CS02]|uniref:TetR family transcriptional regulator n=1 Tax=Streptomyces sp. SP18CS02 TaxID=3002531 RepID=UPI002E76B02B|nr:TetR family transcriptional regulator [Streptomyces sp. SP18CS02]MEE1753402.1 TetR family transcriptional regulator [Streptomyces sp. SP18CS02]
MPTETLTAERILEATEEVLRRYGPAKATVVDVARVLGVSHGSVYRHFRTKAALREAVTERWLSKAEVALAELIAASGEPAAQKLRAWFTELFTAKRRKAGDDPELFATFGVLIEDSSGVVEHHIDVLIDQVRTIVEEGVREGEFTAPDPAATARALFDATTRFHDPEYAPQWRRATIDAEFDAVVDLLLRGLRA